MVSHSITLYEPPCFNRMCTSEDGLHNKLFKTLSNYLHSNFDEDCQTVKNSDKQTTFTFYRANHGSNTTEKQIKRKIKCNLVYLQTVSCLKATKIVYKVNLAMKTFCNTLWGYLVNKVVRI